MLSQRIVDVHMRCGLVGRLERLAVVTDFLEGPGECFEGYTTLAALATGLAQGCVDVSVEYAHERKQGRAPGAARGESSPIVDHPDVKRMLLTTRAQVEAMRLVCYLNVTTLARARHATDPDEAQRLQELCDLQDELGAPNDALGFEDRSEELRLEVHHEHNGIVFASKHDRIVLERGRPARIPAFGRRHNGIRRLR